MSLSDMLSALNGGISSKKAEIEEKISRLKKAKSKIEREQDAAATDVKQIKQPNLGSSWKGERSKDFKSDRSEAHGALQTIINEKYPSYISKIEFKIGTLEAQQTGLSFASSLASDASRLAEKGEDAIEDAKRLISKAWKSL
ncbi:YwqH-like family protein [Bacillus sp. NPDC077027]|uniref:YwqH-like family protein n=1 Tax=Bacillus sp. NPDC077027 TaxID=3390548 RepID=UPI003D059DCC